MKPEPKYAGAPWALAISSVTESFAAGGVGGLQAVLPPVAPGGGVQLMLPPSAIAPVDGAPASPVVPAVTGAPLVPESVLPLDPASTPPPPPATPVPAFGLA